MPASTSDYFEGFLSRHCNRPLLEGFDALDAAFCIHLRDDDAFWNLRLEAGRIVAIERGETSAGAVRYEVDTEAFWAIVRGRLSPQAAFFARRTEIAGDLFLGLKLAKVLGLFFARCPFTETAADEPGV